MRFCAANVARTVSKSKPESGLGSVAEPDRLQLVGVFVDPGALYAEFGGEGRSVHETTINALASLVVE